MSRRNKNNQNNQYNNPYYGNGQYYNGYGNNQYYNQNGQYYNQNGQYYNQNGQYYNPNNMQMQNQYANGKFGINNSNNQKSKKAKPKKDLLIKIGLFAGFAIILVVAVLLINSCNKKEEKEEVPVSYSDTDKQVGNATLGYVTVPTEWLNFQDISSDRGLRYADKDGTYIVTLDALSTSTISAKDYALGIANNLEQSGVTNLKGAEVKLAGYNAYQIYGYHPTENVWLLIYFFEAEDGNTHYIGVEGPERTDEAFKIPDTFSLTEKSE